MRIGLFIFALLLPATMLAQARTEDDTANVIEWAAARKLDWNDFKAPAPNTTRDRL